MKFSIASLTGPVELLIYPDEDRHDYVAVLREGGDLVRVEYDAIVDRGCRQRPPADMVPAHAPVMPSAIANLSRR